jgi:hypothetical protein
MITHHTPYRECRNPGAVYKKVVERIPPRDLDRIQDQEVKEFILMCLADEADRPSAAELLNSHFLCSNGNEKDS